MALGTGAGRDSIGTIYTPYLIANWVSAPPYGVQLLLAACIGLLAGWLLGMGLLSLSTS